MRSSYWQLLKQNREFRKLWLAQAVSLLGDWFNTIALLTLVTRFTDGSALAISALLLARFLPPLLVAPLTGVLADRFNRRRIMVISDILRAITVLVFLLINDGQYLWLLYVLTVLLSGLTALFEPAHAAILPSVVSDDELVTANMLGSVTWSVMLAAGAAVGGFVAALLGPSTALIIDSASFLISALLIQSIRMTGGKSLPVEPVVSQGSFREGVQYILRHPATAATLLVKCGGSIGSIDTLMTIYATEMFVIGANGAGSLGILYAAFGTGAILGPILMNRLSRTGTVQAMRRFIIVAYAFISAGWFLFAGASALALAALAIIVKAMGSSIYWTYSSAILQKTVPDQYLGRVFSFDLAGFRLATVISIFVTGWLTNQASVAQVREVVWATGMISLIPLFLWTLALRWIEHKYRDEPVAASLASAD